MKGIASLCVSFLVVFALQQGVTAWKPKMTPEVEELLIQEGDELRIICQGEGQINFSIQNFTAYSHHYPPFVQSNFTGSFDEASGTYTFIRPRTIPEDTGWYACAEKGIRIRNDEQTIEHPSENISWIYVYVNSLTPFAAGETITSSEILMMSGNDLVIPCRPTSPNLPMKLLDGNVIPVRGSYDTKIGFILKAVRETGATFTCKVEGPHPKNATQILYTTRISGIEMYVVRPDRMMPPHVVWGQDLTLACDITVHRARDISINWTVPSSVPENRLRYFRKVTCSNVRDISHYCTSEMVIKDVLISDYGKYFCTVKDENDYQTEEWTQFQIWDPDYVYINISVISEGYSEINHDQASWQFAIDTYPRDPIVEWYKEDGTLLSPTPYYSGNVRFEYSALGIWYSFSISPPSIEDSGEYTVRVYTLYNAASIVLSLTVLDQPVIHMDNIVPVYAPGVTVHFISRITASPQPNVTWGYIEYPEFPSKLNSKQISLSNLHKEWIEKPPFHQASRVNVTINMTGDLVCRSCNYIGCTEKIQQILVSDVPGFFAIRDPGVVTEGDDISLTCGASVYNYTNSVDWAYKDLQGLEFNSGRMNITKRKTKFTWQSILHIRNVSQSDSGRYACDVKTEKEFRDVTTYQLRVEVPRAPKFIQTNMNNSEIFIDRQRNESEPVLLVCRAQGMPIPEITWYKNNELITESTRYRFSQNNTILQIVYSFNADTDSGRYACKAVNRIGTAERYMDIKIAGNSENSSTWISLFSVLIVISILAITYMGIKVYRKQQELVAAGLTHFEEGALEYLNPNLTVTDQADLLPYDKKWEFPRESLKLGKQLGSGAFGVVMKAEAQGISDKEEVTTVAVKMVRRSADPSYMKALSSELKIMIHLGRHMNVVNLLGACTKTILTKRELYVIVEYCRHGNMHDYLLRYRDNFIDQIDPSTGKIDANIGTERLVRSESIRRQNGSRNEESSFSRSISVKSADSNSGVKFGVYRPNLDFGHVNASLDSTFVSNNSDHPSWRSNYRSDYVGENLKPICTEDLVCWVWQVSRGMEYLSARNVLHGDLAARNILLADDNIVKICDFGLARNMYKGNNYKKTGDGPLPIKWLAIESITDQIFSTQSDVWSFGIVLWEFFTLSRTPYPGMEFDERYVDRLIAGYRMKKPQYATKEIYDFMLDCWEAKPSMRPTFSKLAEKIGALLNESIKMHYLNLNTSYMDMNTTARQSGQIDYLSMMSAPNHVYRNLPDPISEKRRDSAYLSISSLNKTSNPGIFNPRLEVEEPLCSLALISQNTPINSNSEDRIESAPMLQSEDTHIKSVDVRRRSDQFVEETKNKN